MIPGFAPRIAICFQMEEGTLPVGADRRQNGAQSKGKPGPSAKRGCFSGWLIGGLEMEVVGLQLSFAPPGSLFCGNSTASLERTWHLDFLVCFTVRSSAHWVS